MAILKTIHKFMTERGIDEKVQSYIKAEKVRQATQKEQAFTVVSENSDSDPEADYLNEKEREEIVKV